MAYEVNKTNGTVLAYLTDGEIDNTTTGLNLLGKNYLGYGELIAENFVHLLENQANATAPLNDVAGQLWFNTGAVGASTAVVAADLQANRLAVQDTNANWKTIALLAAKQSAPATASRKIGDFWYDTTNKALKIYTADVALPASNDGWVNVGAFQGGSGIAFLDLLDTASPATTHKVVAIYTNYVCVAMISSDADFTIAASHAVSGFNVVGKGINMNTTGNDSTAFNPNAFKLRGISMEAEFADVAEIYVGDADYEAGTLVALGGLAEVTQTVGYADTNIFGIVSTRPAYLMNARRKHDKNALPIAVAGRIPVKVKGEVKRGDRLVASDVPGVAQVAPADVAAWAIIGRSLGDFTGTDIGKVEAVIGAR